MAIVINADSKTVLILDGNDRIDSEILSLLGARGAAMRQVESEVYQTQP